MIIIRVDRVFDIAEQNEAEKTASSFSRTTAPNGSSPQTQQPTTGRKFDEELLIYGPVATNLIEILTSVQRGGSMIRESSWTASF